MPTFQRFVMSFEAQKEGFMAGCRPFIELDGCHLKGPYKEILYTTVALDANSELFPLAACICEQETLSSYVQGIFMLVKFSGQKLKDLFWKASKSCEVHLFKSAMDEIELLNVDARKCLDKIDQIHWSMHCFDTSIKCNHVTNNMIESFNSMLGEHRAITYFCLLEYIRRMVMKRFQERKEACNRWTFDLPPIVKAKLVKTSEESRMLTMLKDGNGEYELLGETRAYLAKLRLGTCDLCVWPEITITVVLPPPLKTQPGRPKVRRREPDERPSQTRGTSVVCTNCGVLGHKY
ncbi:hypothetical protein Dsin_024319 [Dipteronia sinensis]|uniref:MULE transposase domain-containing protein n=1 Tax=Dipteronia sinensis TaxID=43782 RepID=A0AAE0DXA1_9ROSI|nr:hypothetical protein Dsin_024319 [Dipteronia sinensis]